MRPRMVDVARRAGVSVATVSRVLNKTKHVEPAVESAVWQAIEELDFAPNQHARWLSSGRSNVVGVVMPASEDSSHSRFLLSLSSALRPRHLEVMVALSDGERGAERGLTGTLLQSHVSALVVVTPSVDARMRALLSGSDVPALLAFNQDSSARIPAVTFDDAAAATALAAAVPRRPGSVAVLSHGTHEKSVADRVEGFRQVVSERTGTEPDVWECTRAMEDAYRASRELFSRRPPSVLHTTSDYLAIAAIRAAYDLGLSVPDDVAVTGFGVNHYTFAATPSLTTVQVDGAELGRVCGETAIALLDGNDVPALQTVSFSLVPGDSCPLADPEGNPWPR